MLEDSSKPHAGLRPNVYPLSLRLYGTCGAPFTGVARSDRNGTRYYRCRNRNVHAVEAGTKCDDRWLSADDVEHVTWQAVCELLGQPERLVAMAKEYLGIRGEQIHVEREQVDEIDRRIDRLKAALTDRVAEYLAAGVDPEVMTAATATVEAELDQLQTHRQQLTAWKEENLVESERMRRLWELADIAHRRLADMCPHEQALVYDLLEVKVTVIEHQDCPACEGSGYRKGWTRLQAATTSRSCTVCKGTGSVPGLRIEGVVHDTVLVDAAVDTGDFEAAVRTAGASSARCPST
jgi:Recombinase zinc beta ribbon domain